MTGSRVVIEGAVTDKILDAVEINGEAYVLVNTSSGGFAGITREYELAALYWARNREDFAAYPGDIWILGRGCL